MSLSSNKCHFIRIKEWKDRKVKTEIATPEDIIFVKQVPVHPRDRLKRKRKIKLENHDNLTKKIKVQM